MAVTQPKTLSECLFPLAQGDQEVLGGGGGVVSNSWMDWVSPCMVDRGQQKNRGVKECGWLVCSWLPSLNEAADRGVIR